MRLRPLNAHLDYFREGYQLLAAIAPSIQEMLDKGQHEVNSYARTATAWNNKRIDLETQLHRGSFPFMSKERREDLLANPPPPVIVKGMMTRPDTSILKEGYLYKKSSGVRNAWRRRWFMIQNGKLWYFKGGKELSAPQLVCDILLCTVREAKAPELRCCFEIISPNKRAYMLQAMCAKDMQDWTDAIRSAIEAQLVGQPNPYLDKRFQQQPQKGNGQPAKIVSRPSGSREGASREEFCVCRLQRHLT